MKGNRERERERERAVRTQEYILEKHFTLKYLKCTFIVWSGSKKIIQEVPKKKTRTHTERYDKKKNVRNHPCKV